MSALLPNGKQQFIDINGNPLEDGKVYFYIPSTTTPKDTYQNQGLSILNTNPVVLDSRGQAVIWGTGSYRQVLEDADGNQIWDQVVAAPAQSGINNDITELTGLTTPLAISEGGTGADNAADALANLGGVSDATTISTTAPLAGGGDLSTNRTLTFLAPLFQCQMTISGGNAKLSRFGGSWLFIEDANEQIPQAGITIAPTGLTPSTLYYIYAYMDSGTMTLEASTTVPATDTTYGHAIKTSDSTRSLVGAVYVVTGPAFSDTATQRYAISYYNRRTIVASQDVGGPLTTTSTSPVSLSGTPTVNYLNWDNESALNVITGNMSNSTAGNYVFGYLVFSGSIQSSAGFTRQYSGANTEAGPIALCQWTPVTPGGGLTAATAQLALAGSVSAGGTGSYVEIRAQVSFRG